MVNKKFSILLGVIFCMCFVCSCSLFYPNRFNRTNDESNVLKNVGSIIIDDFINNNMDDLRTYLSPKALQTDDLNEGFSYIHGLLTESQIVNIEQKGSPIQGQFKWNERWEKGSTSFIITMSSGISYCLYFEYWFVNQTDESMLGINRIEIFNNGEINETFNSNKFSSYTGIYNPKWGSYTD